jgi:excisionase family DNA binding protein
VKPRIVSDLLTPAEAALLLQCHPKTVVRRVSAGRLSACRTLGNHRRIRIASVRQALLEGGMTAAEFEERLAAVRG